MKFVKSLAAAASAVLLSTAAMAAGTITVSGGTATALTSFEGISTAGYASELTNNTNKLDVGALLKLNYLSNVTFTFVGKEASYANKLFVFNVGQFTNRVAPNSSVSFSNVAAGVLNFGFQSDSKGSVFTNPNSRIGFMTNKDDTAALALFNDAAADRDYDDMGVRISVTAVPEPESYAMMLAGLGLMGMIARRRKSKSA